MGAPPRREEASRGALGGGTAPIGASAQFTAAEPHRYFYVQSSCGRAARLGQPGERYVLVAEDEGRHEPLRARVARDAEDADRRLPVEDRQRSKASAPFHSHPQRHPSWSGETAGAASLRSLSRWLRLVLLFSARRD